ncbi:MAG: NAD-binding protein [Candidatus Omnitrophica bacterium]|nr:NAD-binding protein [Candidatus Omnitrophota bacterium]
MYIVIAGGGRLGYLLAKKLQSDNHKLCIIDESLAVCEHLAEEFRGLLVINGDASDPEILTEAKVDKADVVVGATPFDEANIIICNIAKELFNVKRTVARVNNPKHLMLYKYMGVDVPVDSTSIIARIVEEEASFSDVMSLLSIKKGRLSIVRVDIPKESPVINKKLKDLKLPSNSVLISIIRGTEIIIPSGMTEILVDDEIIAATLIDSEKELIHSLIGKL